MAGGRVAGGGNSYLDSLKTMNQSMGQLMQFINQDKQLQEMKLTRQQNEWSKLVFSDPVKLRRLAEEGDPFLTQGLKDYFGFEGDQLKDIMNGLANFPLNPDEQGREFLAQVWDGKIPWKDAFSALGTASRNMLIDTSGISSGVSMNFGGSASGKAGESATTTETSSQGQAGLSRNPYELARGNERSQVQAQLDTKDTQAQAAAQTITNQKVQEAQSLLNPAGVASGTIPIGSTAVPLVRSQNPVPGNTPYVGTPQQGASQAAGAAGLTTAGVPGMQTQNAVKTQTMQDNLDSESLQLQLNRIEQQKADLQAQMQANPRASMSYMPQLQKLDQEAQKIKDQMAQLNGATGQNQNAWFQMKQNIADGGVVYTDKMTPQDDQVIAGSIASAKAAEVSMQKLGTTPQEQLTGAQQLASSQLPAHKNIPYQRVYNTIGAVAASGGDMPPQSKDTQKFVMDMKVLGNDAKNALSSSGIKDRLEMISKMDAGMLANFFPKTYNANVQTNEQQLAWARTKISDKLANIQQAQVMAQLKAQAARDQLAQTNPELAFAADFLKDYLLKIAGRLDYSDYKHLDKQVEAVMKNDPIANGGMQFMAAMMNGTGMGNFTSKEMMKNFLIFFNKPTGVYGVQSGRLENLPMNQDMQGENSSAGVNTGFGDQYLNARM